MAAGVLVDAKLAAVKKKLAVLSCLKFGLEMYAPDMSDWRVRRRSPARAVRGHLGQ